MLNYTLKVYDKTSRQTEYKMPHIRVRNKTFLLVTHIFDTSV